MLVIIEQHVLARTCILNILRRELTGFEIVEMATTSGLSWFSGRDIRLIALNIGDKEITDPAIEVSLAFLAEFCPKAPLPGWQTVTTRRRFQPRCSGGSVAFSRDRSRSKSPSPDCAWFLPAGLPALADRWAKWSVEPHTETRPTFPSYPKSTRANGVTKLMPEKAMVDLTPREQQVLAALGLGLPNKLIAARLGLSENTVKMHIQHIMRKCAAHNRTEAVLRWSGRMKARAPRSRMPSS